MADVSITLTVPSAKVATIRDGVLKVRPIPLDDAGAPKYTLKQWFAELIADYLERLAEAGLREIARDAVAVDVTITR